MRIHIVFLWQRISANTAPLPEMYKLDIRVDAKEEAATERRRSLEQQRQARIFNARERTIGVDVGFLEKQARERKQRELEEKQRHEAFAQEMTRHDKVVELLQQRQEKDIIQLNKSLTEYRKEHQRKQDRREFDLYDPDSKKKDKPARVSDEDQRMTVSGMQAFAGEDLKYEKRKELQQKQIREWTVAQIAEKERLTSEQKHADRLYHMKACELDQRAVDLACAEAETRRNITTATKDYNLALAREKAAQKQQEMAQEQEDNLTELSNHVHGDLLTEDPAVAQSAFGPHRVIPDRWKGMSPRQIGEIRATQGQQKLEKQTLQSEEREREREWERRRIAEARAGLVLETQLNRCRKDDLKKLAQENRQMAEEQLARQRKMKEEVYVNKPSEEYFKQFNTTSR